MKKQKLLPTSEIASILGVQSATVRRGFCLDGHYMGLRPIKLPNHRLLWPEKDLEQLLKKTTGTAPSAS